MSKAKFCDKYQINIIYLRKLLTFSITFFIDIDYGIVFLPFFTITDIKFTFKV